MDYKDIFEDAFANNKNNYAKVTVPTAIIIIIILRVQTSMLQLEFRYSVTFFTFNRQILTCDLLK